MSASDETDHYQGALLEVMDSKLDAILEAHQPLATVPNRLTQLEDRVGRLEDDMTSVKAAIKDQSREIKDTGRRVKGLETSALFS